VFVQNDTRTNIRSPTVKLSWIHRPRTLTARLCWVRNHPDEPYSDTLSKPALADPRAFQ